MSRIGKKPIVIPSDVVIDLNKSTHAIAVTGKLGTLKTTTHPDVIVDIVENNILVSVINPNNQKQNSLWGTSQAIIANMVQGVTEGYTKSLELNGVGYKMELADILTLYIGFSHPVKVTIPKEIKLTLNKNLLSGTSTDKQLIGDFFATVFKMKPCDVYKHKGFKFPGAFYRKKVGKKSK
jgi:large subunit ribosomal protein L6